jgi:putative redox protein
MIQFLQPFNGGRIVDAKVTWRGKLAFSGSANSGFTLPLDADAGVGGEESGFRPMELLATGLAACTAMDVISILGKKRQNVTDFEVAVHAEQAVDHPHVFTRAVLTYKVTGKELSETAVVRSIELSATRYCPAQAMLENSFPIKLLYEIYEDEGEGKRRQVGSGEYIKFAAPINP